MLQTRLEEGQGAHTPSSQPEPPITRTGALLLARVATLVLHERGPVEHFLLVVLLHSSSTIPLCGAREGPNYTAKPKLAAGARLSCLEAIANTQIEAHLIAYQLEFLHLHNITTKLIYFLKKSLVSLFVIINLLLEILQHIIRVSPIQRNTNSFLHFY